MPETLIAMGMSFNPTSFQDLALSARLLEHPLSEGTNETAVLGDGDEHLGVRARRAQGGASESALLQR